MPSLIVISPVVLEKKIYKFRQCIFAISQLSPLEKGGPFIWRNLNPHHPRMHCAKFVWNWPCGSGKDFFLISSMYFRYNVIISHWKREGSFIWTNLNPLHLRMLCAKFTTMPTKWQRLTTDKFRSEKFTWAFGSGELKKDVKELIGYSF